MVLLATDGISVLVVPTEMMRVVCCGSLQGGFTRAPFDPAAYRFLGGVYPQLASFCFGCQCPASSIHLPVPSVELDKLQRAPSTHMESHKDTQEDTTAHFSQATLYTSVPCHFAEMCNSSSIPSLSGIDRPEATIILFVHSHNNWAHTHHTLPRNPSPYPRL